VKLVDDWKRAWRWLSIQISALGALASAAWIITPEERQIAILAAFHIKPGMVPLVLFLAVILGRLKLQSPPSEEKRD
jgi:hypothetical protein